VKHAHRKPIAERYQTMIATTILVAMIGLTIAAIGYWFPVDPSSASAPSKAERVLR
jgi:hypothetical protein